MSGSESIVVYYVPLAFQCIHGCSDEGGENGDGEEGSGVRFLEEGRLEIDCPLVCNLLRFTW